ncbi:poly(A)-specific ribonuclease [Caenorhabditis elegans]|uniref:poly(A)-specific ribonuclease n=2 Tax=Caenorhabditis elegans TaxID=6239 RepID=B3GWC3_CAEEL|nr:Endonuclease/exonuclease/phosphatase domain-containing protein [Caenorhabditis elegans]CAQ58128.1 Endonuclease/exonuclease/phosphatase domain-containing protein [Caenorhabditis elegans]|eukprot:NP_001129877.1 CCR (yeast CCR4/NOT complex component) homolog [Caenorhabditis elegans]
MADSGDGESPSRRNSSGKRFVRRARRWAELLQKRQGRRNCEESENLSAPIDANFQQAHKHTAFNNPSSHNRNGIKDQKYRPPEPPHVYDYVEMAALGSGVMVVDDDLNYEFLTHDESRQKQHLGHTRSFPITILQSRKHEISSGLSPAYGYNTHQTCQRTISDAYHYQAYHQPSYSNHHTSWYEYQQPSNASFMKPVDSALTLITNDLSMASISEASTTSPSSISNNSEEDVSPHFLKMSSSFPKSSSFPYRTMSESQCFPFNFHVNTHPPPERNWVMIRHADPERPIATFTVLCYNVLCDKYATVNQYSYCPSWALNWEYRKGLIIKEIRTYEADVITLQEVETEQFRTLFQPELKQLGYAGIFEAKSRAKTMGEEERKYVDGCAIFWKVDKFDMDKQYLFEFSSVAMKKASTSENMLNRVMPRDNIGLCAVLKIKESVYANKFLGRMQIPMNDNVVGNPLVVATAHIHWDPEFCDVKLVQSMMLTHEVSRVLEEVSKKYQITQQQVPVLICGDFNSLPDSGVFEYLSKGQITRRHMDLKSFRDDSCLEKFTNSTDKNVISHPLRLDSACDINSIPFTNYTLDFKGMIDYIFATPQSLARLGILGPFDPQWVQSNKILGFPHPHVASDHIPIMAQYAIIPTTHQRQQPLQQAGPAAGVIGGGFPSTPSGAQPFLRC